MGTIFGTIFAFAIVFGVLVFIHEFGHFFMGKLVGIRVEVFSFGYGKRLFGFKKGDTDYRVSLIPMGGYVRFLGEPQAEGGLESGKDTGEPLTSDHFMAKKRWQRFLVILMGSLMNILLAIVIMTAINMIGGSTLEYLEERPVIGWIEPGSPADKSHLLVDDEILSINRRKVKTWNETGWENPGRRPSHGKKNPLRDGICRILRKDNNAGDDGDA
jgi:regulator of sigma E protease